MDGGAFTTEQDARGARGQPSLERRLRLLLSAVLGLALVIALGIGYFTTVRELEAETRASLPLLTEQRARVEQARFHFAEQSVARLRADLLERLGAMGDEDPKAAFDALFERYPDGLWRVRPELDHPERLPSFYLRHDAPMNASVRRRAVASYRLLAERGPSLTPPFYSVYMDFVERGLMVFSRGVNWGAGATRETDNYRVPDDDRVRPREEPGPRGLLDPRLLRRGGPRVAGLDDRAARLRGAVDRHRRS